MSVIPLTIFFSLLLAVVFIVLFARDQRHRPLGGAERDSLLPLADELPVAAIPMPSLAAVVHHDHADDDHDDHDHHHKDGSACGCRDGSRPPCVGCLKRTTPLARADR